MSATFETFSPGTGANELLARPLQFFTGVGPIKAGLLARLNLQTIQDLLFHFPTAHKDRATVTPIAALTVGKDANIVAQIIDMTAKRFNGKEQITAYLMDASGAQIQAVWWNPLVADRLTPNHWGFFSGKITAFGSRRQVSNAEFEVFGHDEFDSQSGAVTTGPSFGRIVPIYNLRPKHRLPDGQEAPEIRINQNALRKFVWDALELGAAEQLRDQIPESVRLERRLMPLAEAVRQFHFPDSFQK